MLESTWGLSVSSEQRCVAVSANSHLCTIFDLKPSMEATKALLAEIPEQPRVSLACIPAAPLDLQAGGRFPRRSVLRGHRNNIPCVDFSPCGRLVASVSLDSSVRVWSLDGHQIASFCPTSDWMWGVRWLSPESIMRVSRKDPFFSSHALEEHLQRFCIRYYCVLFGLALHAGFIMSFGPSRSRYDPLWRCTSCHLVNMSCDTTMMKRKRKRKRREKRKEERALKRKAMAKSMWPVFWGTTILRLFSRKWQGVANEVPSDDLVLLCCFECMQTLCGLLSEIRALLGRWVAALTRARSEQQPHVRTERPAQSSQRPLSPPRHEPRPQAPSPLSSVPASSPTSLPWTSCQGNPPCCLSGPGMYSSDESCLRAHWLLCASKADLFLLDGSLRPLTSLRNAVPRPRFASPPLDRLALLEVVPQLSLVCSAGVEGHLCI